MALQVQSEGRVLSPRQAHLSRALLEGRPGSGTGAKSPQSGGPPGSHSSGRWTRGDSFGFYSNQSRTGDRGSWRREGRDHRPASPPLPSSERPLTLSKARLGSCPVGSC